VCYWFQFCREVILDFIENKSEITGGEGKVIEIDESKFGKRKYHRGHYVKCQCPKWLPFPICLLVDTQYTSQLNNSSAVL
jgi:hypothetical protein